MARVRWSHEAEVSLRAIYEYIARDRPATAWRTVESILNRASSLIGYPTAGQVYPYMGEHSIRVLSYGHFQIAYRVSSGEDVVILAVFHGLIFLPRK